MRVAFFTDIHINGKRFSDCELALHQLADSLEKYEPDVIIDGGDLFDTSRISDKYRSLGDQQRLALDFFNRFSHIETFILEGNHTAAGAKKSALEFLEDGKRTIVRTPIVVKQGNCAIGMLPWINKSTFYSTECVGLSQSESQQKYTKALYDMLGYFKEEFKGRTSLLFAHCELQGTAVNAGYTMQAGSFSFTLGALEQTGAHYVSVGHYHTRGGPYAGALFQHNFAEENNPSGYELIDIDESTGDISAQYVELDIVKYKTLVIDKIEDVPHCVPANNHYRLLFNSQDAYVKVPQNLLQRFTVEKRWEEKQHVARTETSLSVDMSDSELLSEYITHNPLPEGIDPHLIYGCLDE